MSANEIPATYRVGDASVTKISEIIADFPAGKLLPGYEPPRCRRIETDREPRAVTAATCPYPSIRGSSGSGP